MPTPQNMMTEPQPLPGSALALTHGAGANSESPLLIAIEAAFEQAGIAVVRFDLAFRKKRRSGPPHPSSAAADRESIRDVMAELRSRFAGPVYLGGHSYGGRQASMLAAEDPQIASALLLLSYPLHPPNKPDQLRTAHFPALRTPCVFVHGDNDPFGSVDELRSAMTLIPSSPQLIVIEGAGHDLKKGRFDIAPVVRALARPIGNSPD